MLHNNSDNMKPQLNQALAQDFVYESHTFAIRRKLKCVVSEL